MMWIVEKYVKYLLLFAMLWGILFAYRTFSCAKVSSGAMVPSLTDEQFLLVYNKIRLPEQIQRGDVVYYHREVSSDRNRDFFGRIIAKAGERVRMEKGIVYVNGEQIAEPYVSEQNRDHAEEFTEITVPRDHYFILNDNRRIARKDSRSFGPVSVLAVLGKARM